MTTRDTDLSIRFDKLERQLKFWRALTILMVILYAGGVVGHLGAAPTRIDATAVVAHEFDLANASGRITARLASDPDSPDSPNLVLKYPNDKPAVLIGIDSKSGASISVLNNSGQPRAIMSEGANGSAFSLFDEDDKLRIALVALTQGPQIAIYNKATKRVWVVPTNFMP